MAGITDAKQERRTKTAPSTLEKGSAGIYVQSGVMSEEYLNELGTITLRAEKFDRMRKSDSTVNAALLAMELPIVSRRWNIKPASGGDLDREIAAFVKHCLLEGAMSISWVDLMMNILSFLQYGYSIFEKVWKKEDWRYAPSPGSELREEKYKLKKLAFRHPRTLYKWLFDEEGGLKGIEQYAYYITKDGGYYKKQEIPVEDLVVFTHRRIGNDFEGVSVLRNIYKHFKLLEGYYKCEAIAIERFSTGIPALYYPASYPDDSPEVANAQNLVRRIHLHEESGMAIPDDWRFEIYEAKMNGGDVLQKAIQHQRFCIFTSMLNQFLALGQDGNGTYALSKNQSDFFVIALNAILRQVSETINRFVVKPLVDNNYNTEKYPELFANDFGAEDQEPFVKGIEAIGRSGYLVPYDGLADHIAQVMGLPEREAGGKESRVQEVEGSRG